MSGNRGLKWRLIVRMLEGLCRQAARGWEVGGSSVFALERAFIGN